MLYSCTIYQTGMGQNTHVVLKVLLHTEQIRIMNQKGNWEEWMSQTVHTCLHFVRILLHVLSALFPHQNQCVGGGSKGKHLPAWHRGGWSSLLLLLAWTAWQLQTDTFWQFQWVTWKHFKFYPVMDQNSNDRPSGGPMGCNYVPQTHVKRFVMLQHMEGKLLQLDRQWDICLPLSLF